MLPNENDAAANIAAGMAETKWKTSSGFTIQSSYLWWQLSYHR